MSNIISQLSTVVSPQWTRTLAQAGLCSFVLFTIVYTSTTADFDEPVKEMFISTLAALELGLPILLLVLCTWWRRRMSGWTWWLHLLAMLACAIELYVVSRVPLGTLNALVILLPLVVALSLSVVAILLGWGIDYFLYRLSQQHSER